MYIVYIFICPRCNTLSNYVGNFECVCPYCELKFAAERAPIFKANLTYDEVKLLLDEEVCYE